MYCRNCGNEVNEKAVGCPKCGFNPRTEKNYCSGCGVETNPNQVMCISCGVSLTQSGSTLGTLNENTKLIAILSHLSLPGLLIAFILNNQNKSDLGSFYIRQNLGIAILSFLVIIPLLGFFIVLPFTFVMWVISLMNAINEKPKPIPLVGEMFQGWFKGL